MQPEFTPPTLPIAKEMARHFQSQAKIAELFDAPRRAAAEVAAKAMEPALAAAALATHAFQPPDFLGPLRQQQAEMAQRIVEPMQERLAAPNKVAERSRYTPTLPSIPVDTAEFRTARYTQELTAVAGEQHELLRELRDQLAQSEERRAKAEERAAEEEAKRHAGAVRTAWWAATVGAFVGAVPSTVLTLLLR